MPKKSNVGKPDKVFQRGNTSSAENLIPKVGSKTTLKESAEFFMPGRNFGQPPSRIRTSPRKEIGYPGLEVYGGYVHEEFITDLQGRRGLQVYEEMRRNDPIIGAMLLIAEQLIHNSGVVVSPSPQNPEAQESLMARDLVKTGIDDLANTWTDTLSEILTFLPFGWSYCSVWHKKREGYHRDTRKSSRYNDGKFGWAGISLRGQSTLLRWEMNENGRALGMIQQGPPRFDTVFIPETHSAHFRTRTEKENPEGYSILRNSWRAYKIKKYLEEVEGIGLERDLAGLPVLITPEGIDLWNENDSSAAATLERANNVVRLARIDKYSGLVLPFGWEFKLINSSGQRANNSNTIINRWDQRIAVTMLADMLLIGHESVGSFALVQSKARLFSSALESYAARIAGVFNRQLIPRLMLLNGIQQEYWPMMAFGPVETPSLIDLAKYMEALSSVGVNIDEVMGLYARSVAGFPPPNKGENAVKTFEDTLEEQEKTQEMFDKFKDKTDTGDNFKPGDKAGHQSDGDKDKSKSDNKDKSNKNKSRAMMTDKGIVVSDEPLLRYSLGLD